MAGQLLASWVCGNELKELANDGGVMTASQISLNAVLKRQEPLLFEAGYLVLEHQFEREVGKGRPPPEPECLAQERSSPFVLAVDKCVTPNLNESSKVLCVEDVVGTELEHVAGSGRLDEARSPERLAQARDMNLDRLHRASGRVITPQGHDETLDANRLART